MLLEESLFVCEDAKETVGAPKAQEPYIGPSHNPAIGKFILFSLLF